MPFKPPRTHRRPRTKEANEALIEAIRPLRERGLSGEQIARKLGDVSSDNVRYFCRKYGIKPYPTGTVGTVDGRLNHL